MRSELNAALHVSRNSYGELGVNVARTDGEPLDEGDVDLLFEVFVPEIAELFVPRARPECTGFGKCPRGQHRGHYNRETGALTCDECPL